MRQFIFNLQRIIFFLFKKHQFQSFVKCQTWYLSLLLTFLVINLYGQTTWTGAASSDWNTSSNWTDGVPDASSVVNIPNVSRGAVINTGTVAVQAISVATGGALTIAAGVTLSVNGSVEDGISNYGTVHNHGRIAIGSTTSIGRYGIYNNGGTFSNNAGSELKIDNCARVGFLIEAGTITNASKMEIGKDGSVGDECIVQGSGTFTNEATGLITADNVWYGGFRLHYGSFTNQGRIVIGTHNASDMRSGLMVFRTVFTNNGEIQIDKCSNSGIYLYHTDGSIQNNGIFKVGMLKPISKLLEVANDGRLFSNNVGGVFQGTGLIQSSIFVNAGGTVSPGYSPGKQSFDGSINFANSIMNMEVNGTGAAGVAYDQIEVDGTATLGGTLAVTMNYSSPSVGDEMTIFSATSISGTFGTVTGLPTGWSVKYSSINVKLVYAGEFGNIWNGSVSTAWKHADNWSSGIPSVNSEVYIPLASRAPTISTNDAVAKSVLIESGGILTIDQSGQLSVNGAASEGFWNQGTVHNFGEIQVGNISSAGNYGVYNEGVLNNKPDARIVINRVVTAGVHLSAGEFVNEGELLVGDLTAISNLITANTGELRNKANGIVKGNGRIDSGKFINEGGALSPGTHTGIITLSAAFNFANNTLMMDVNGVEVGGIDYDQVLVTGVATLGGTLQLNINYTPTIGDQIHILNADYVVGTFASVVGMPSGWKIIYYPTSVWLVYGTGPTTWTGDVDSDWSNVGNWSAGIPDATSDVIIANRLNQAHILSGVINAKSLLINENASLTISTGATLQLKRSYSVGMRVYGSVINNGTIVIKTTGTDGINSIGSIMNNGRIDIGSASKIGRYGIYYDGGTFNNNAGSELSINNCENSGFFIETGTITNASKMEIGKDGSVGGEAIVLGWGTFSNSATGVITADNAWYAGMRLHGGDFTNAGKIIIGNNSGRDSWSGLMVYMCVLTNNGEIQIDRCSNSGIFLYHSDGSIQNNGNFKVGMLKPISKLLEIANDGRLFSNNVGGVFQGTGTIQASIFVNAGGTLSPGYSPGIQTFNSPEDFSSSIMAMEVNGTGAGVAYDQIVVNGTATLGGTLALSINYAAPADGTVITLLTTTALVGTFNAVTGLPENWELKYNYPSTGKISMEYTDPLPVKWVYFQGQLSENGVMLRWKTASEIHNLRFEVERSLDALHWQKIGFVEGNGDTNTQSLYHFLDTTTPSGIHYYRLKQIDLDGQFEFSSIIHVQGKNNAIKAYPNPTQGIVRIEGVLPDVKVYNILGREVKRETMKGQDLDLSDLPNGLYIISVLNGHQAKSISVMKQN